MEWINCNEQKPEYEKNVIVCRPNKYSGKNDILIAKLHPASEHGTEYGRGNGMGGGYESTYDDYWSLPAIVLYDTITHWMPLPKDPDKNK